jgi:hypothetical protein
LPNGGHFAREAVFVQNFCDDVWPMVWKKARSVPN